MVHLALTNHERHQGIQAIGLRTLVLLSSDGMCGDCGVVCVCVGVCVCACEREKIVCITLPISHQILLFGILQVLALTAYVREA